jgi:hypothetical protein
VQTFLALFARDEVDGEPTGAPEMPAVRDA